MTPFRFLLIAITCTILTSARAADMSPEQKDATAKLQAKGALVIPVAANSEALIVSLSTVGKNAGDADLVLVKALPKIEQLDLRNTAITNAGLVNLDGMAGLTHLHLEGTAVTDEGLAHVKGMTNLTYLNLYNTAVTDKGVAELSGLKNLKRLFLWQTKVTEAGVTGLKKSLPELYVNRGEEMAMTTQPYTPAKVEPKPEPKKEAAKPGDKKPEEKKPEEKKPAQAVPAVTATAVPLKAVNTKCPVSGKDVDPAHVVLFEGKAVGLCCDKCEAKFVAEPKKYIDKVVADVK